MALLPIDQIRDCVGTHVDVRLTVEQLDQVAEDADGMAETWNDYARDSTTDEDRAEYERRARLWEQVARHFYKIRLDLDRRARERGC